MKPPDTPTSDPEDLARREAAAHAALEAALSGAMEPKEASERQLRTIYASFMKKSRDATARIVRASHYLRSGTVAAISRPFNVYLNQAFKNLLDDNAVNRKAIKDEIRDAMGEAVAKLSSLIIRVAVLLVLCGVAGAFLVVWFLRR